MLRVLICAALAVAVAARPAMPAARPSVGKAHLSPLLRYRGGAKAQPSSGGQQQHKHLPIVSAAQKLCAHPGLIAASGTNSGRTIARHIRGVVFGGLDGILTTFALLAAMAGSKQISSSLTLVIGISTVLADALSMAAGEYLSAKAENELGGARDPDEPGPLEKAVAMFLAFTIFGSLPLLGFVASGSSSSFQSSVAITAGTLFALGGIKSQFGIGVWWRAGIEVTSIGGVAAAVAYFSARAVEQFMG
jgi:VIT1/CCC1 family predicted Fe2+/Mn2+ transporter